MRQQKQQEDWDKWVNALVDFGSGTGVKVDGNPQRMHCGQEGISKKAFPLYTSDGQYNSAEAAYEWHKTCCWKQCNAERAAISISVVKTNDDDEKARQHAELHKANKAK